MAKYSPKTKMRLKELVEDNSVYLGDIDISNITDMEDLFRDSKRVDFSGIEKWDTSKVKTMNGMFSDAHCFNHNINDWNVSNVENMRYMFANTPFNQPLDKWSVSRVANMSGMFCNTPFNQPLNDWDTSSVTNMSSMFSSAPFNQPLDKWNVSKVTDMSDMFYDSHFNQNINDWDVSNVESMRQMFQNNTYFNQPLDKWNVASLTEANQMFDSASSFTQSIESWNVTSLGDEYKDRIFDNLSPLQRKELKLPSWWLKMFSKPKAQTFRYYTISTASVICEQLKVAYIADCDGEFVNKMTKKYPSKIAAMEEQKKTPYSGVIGVALGYNPNAIGIEDLKFLIGMDKEKCENLCRTAHLAVVATIKGDKVSAILGVYDTILDALEAMPYTKENTYLGYQPIMKANEVVGRVFAATQKAMEWIHSKPSYMGEEKSYWWVEVNDKGIITKIVKAIEHGDENDRDEMKVYKDDLPKADNGCHYELIEIVFKYKVNRT